MLQSDNNFMTQQQMAVERMMEMNRRSKFVQSNSETKHNMPPAPSFVRLNKNEQYTNGHNDTSETPKNFSPAPKKESPQTGFSLPILDTLKIDRDTTLILGLLLILWSEKSDRYLLLALLYILL